MPIKPFTVLLWFVLYLALAALPLLVAMGIERPEPRALLVEFGAMLGLLGLGMLAMQLLMSGRHRWFAAGVGPDNLLQFHRRTGLAAWLFILAHPLLLILGDTRFVAWLDPREDWLRTIGVATLALAVSALIISSIWRQQLNLQYETWRSLHAGLSLIVVAGGLGHALLGNHHTAGLLTQMLLVAVVAVPLLLLLEMRLWRPWKLRRRPWLVQRAEDTRADSHDLILIADGHAGLHFKPGQFAWLTWGDSPYSTQQHPFSMASSACNASRVEFLIKEAGDFTAQLAGAAPGDRFFIDGPYGSFTMDAHSDRRAVFIAGGIGLAPILSMLRTRIEWEYRCPVWLIYASKAEEDIIMRNTVEALTSKLPLTLVHVLSHPSDAWTGESGHVDATLLDNYLPPDADDIDYFLCGPPPMMDTVEPELKKRSGSARRIYSERFGLV